jgi:hypothetical protein
MPLTPELSAQIEALLAAAYPPEKPGAAPIFSLKKVG